jgi:hypothetical protein
MKMVQNFDYRIYTAPVEFVTEIRYVTGISGSIDTICIGSSGSNLEQAPRR